MHESSIKPMGKTIKRITQSRGARCNRLKGRPDVSGRPRDNAKNLASGHLLLKRFGQLVRSRLLGFEQAHVLDRYHRLIGKCSQELDLLLGKPSRLGSCYDDGTDSVA